MKTMNSSSDHEADDQPQPQQIGLSTRRTPRWAPGRSWLAWAAFGMGLLSLLWFLIRVIPKPSRATYPCQRLAFPVASSFVLWVVALLGSAAAWRRARMRDLRSWKACLWGAVAVAGCGLVWASLPVFRARADNPPHGMYGVAKGIFPGRVAWVHAPDATSWAGYTSPEHWYETNHTDLAVVEEMMSKAVQAVGGSNSDAAAWDALFKYFNQRHGRGERGYQAGEKIAIKINLTTCNARSGSQTVDITGTYEKRNSYSDGHWLNTIDNSPQMLLSLLRHLVYTAGVSQTNIFLGDPKARPPLNPPRRGFRAGGRRQPEEEDGCERQRAPPGIPASPCRYGQTEEEERGQGQKPPEIGQREERICLT